jgi:hypothetical protein
MTNHRSGWRVKYALVQQQRSCAVSGLHNISSVLQLHSAITVLPWSRKFTISTPLWSLKTVTMTFLTDNVALNFFTRRLLLFPHSGFLCVCHMINPCFITCNSALQKLLSIISIVLQTHERQSDMMSFCDCKGLWCPAHTFV